MCGRSAAACFCLRRPRAAVHTWIVEVRRRLRTHTEMIASLTSWGLSKQHVVSGPAPSLPESSLPQIRPGALPRASPPRSGRRPPVVSSAQWLIEHVRRRGRRPPRIDRCFAFDGGARLKPRSRNLLPCTARSLTTRRKALLCGSRATEPRSDLRALRLVVHQHEGSPASEVCTADGAVGCRISALKTSQPRLGNVKRSGSRPVRPLTIVRSSARTPGWSSTLGMRVTHQ